MKQFNIKIEKPCQENFLNFKPTDNGAFCDSCKTTVIDFTQMSEKEIIQYFKNNTGKTCGRFHKAQLKKTYPAIIKQQRNDWVGLKWTGAAAMSFALFLTAPDTSAQVQNTAPSVNQSSVKMGKVHAPQTTQESTVKGKVVDHSGDALPGVNIVLKGTETGTFSDLDGNFTFPKKLNAGDTLLFSFIGMETVEHRITKGVNFAAPIKIEMIDFCTALLGEVAYSEVYSSKPTFWQRVKGWFSK